ncbi:MAG: CCA tRNA nucleotidyltransferase [Undibacterium sp.]
MHYSIPSPVYETLHALEQAGFKAYIVGGSLRDILLGRTPKDWDITTDALPERVQEIFPDNVYENSFGTVGVKVPRFLESTALENEHDIIEVTTFRTESGYSDERHPDAVTFVTAIEDDLARRDFTINAIAGKVAAVKVDKTSENHLLATIEIIDPFRGVADLEKHILRAVGKPEDRFKEDALRLIRAIRLLTELQSEEVAKGALTSWKIDDETFAALKHFSSHIENIAKERIRDEFSRIIRSKRPAFGVALLLETGLLQGIIPELVEGVGVTQNLHHIYTVWEHNLRALETCPSSKLSVRLATLLHDVAKPRTKNGDGLHSTFYNHDHVGARMTRKILERLRYPKQIIDHASMLVDNHLFYYNVGEVTEASVRRLIKRVGLEHMDDLMAVRIGDRLGSGVPKAKPYKLRHLEYMIEKVSQDPTSVKMLKVNGSFLMEKLNLPPSPKIGALLDCLLAEVIEDPGKNTADWLLDRARELMDNDLDVLRTLAKERIEEKKEAEDKSIRGRHYVT